MDSIYFDYLVQAFIAACIIAALTIIAYRVGYKNGTRDGLLDIMKKMKEIKDKE